MAIITRGKDKGKKVALGQWCNDWFTVKGSNKVYSPLSLKLTPAEVSMVLASDSGIMLSLFTLDSFHGTFKLRKR